MLQIIIADANITSREGFILKKSKSPFKIINGEAKNFMQTLGSSNPANPKLNPSPAP